MECSINLHTYIRAYLRKYVHTYIVVSAWVITERTKKTKKKFHFTFCPTIIIINYLQISKSSTSVPIYETAVAIIVAITATAERV